MDWWQTLIVAVASGVVGFVGSAWRDSREWERRRKDLADEREHLTRDAEAQRTHELNMAAEERAAAERKSREERQSADREAMHRQSGELLAEGARAMRALLMHERAAVHVYRGLVEKHGDDVDMWVSFDRDRDLEGQAGMAVAHLGLNVSDQLRQQAWHVMGTFAALRAHDYDPSRTYQPPRRDLSSVEREVERFEEEAAADLRKLAHGLSGSGDA